MEPWVPSVISGIFSITVVALGAYLINAREKNRADKDGQREAVIHFLHADRTLSAKLLREMIEVTPYRDYQKMDPATIIAVTRLRMLYFNDCIQELLIADLSIHDPNVRKNHELLLEACSYQYVQYRDFLDHYSSLIDGDLPAIFKEILSWETSLEKYRSARKKFIDVARTQYRIK